MTGTADDLTRELKSTVTLLAGAPSEFWTREHRAVVFHCIRLIRALHRYAEAGGSGTLVPPLDVPEDCLLAEP